MSRVLLSSLWVAWCLVLLHSCIWSTCVTKRASCDPKSLTLGINAAAYLFVCLDSLSMWLHKVRSITFTPLKHNKIYFIYLLVTFKWQSFLDFSVKSAWVLHCDESLNYFIIKSCDMWPSFVKMSEVTAIWRLYCKVIIITVLRQVTKWLPCHATWDSL